MREHSGQACCFLGFGVRGGLRSRPVGVIFESAGLDFAVVVGVAVAVGVVVVVGVAVVAGVAAVVGVDVVVVVAGASGRPGASTRGKSWRWILAAAAAAAVADILIAVATDIGDDDGTNGCC